MISFLGSSGSGGRNEGVVAEDRNEDERRQETDRGQQRERDGARVVDRDRRRGEIVSPEFKIQKAAPIARNVPLRQSRSRGRGGGVSKDGFVLVDVVIGLIVSRAIQEATAINWV